MLLWMIPSLLLIAAAFLLFFLIKKRENNPDPKIMLEYTSDEDDQFKISGKKSSFIINKNNRFEYLVENGLIVACRDKSKSSQFKYYGG